ncbi:MAG: GreA/GreB family elongation factor [Gemmatimonadota bacterium]
MIRKLRDKLGKEIGELSFELTVTLPKAIATAVEMGDLRENSEYKAALERQQLVQARLSQLHQRLQQVMELSNTNTPADKVGLGSSVTVKDIDTGEKETYMLVLAEMVDVDEGHITFASPLGRALRNRGVGEEVELVLPTKRRRLKILKLEAAAAE